MQNIKPLVESVIIELQDKSSYLDNIKGTRTGFHSLDQMLYGLKNGELIVIGARPAMGKSSFALQIAFQVARDEKKPALYFSSEMLASEISMNLLSTVSKVNSKKLIKKSYTENENDQILKATIELSKLPIFINDDYSPTVEEIAKECFKLKEVQGLALVVVDYLQMIKGESGLRTEEQIGKIMKDLKGLARVLDCPIILLSQLSRSVETRPSKRPHLHDFRESGTIEQIADVVMFIYRDEVYNPDTREPGIAEIIIAKNRINGVGTCKLKWDGGSMRFEDFNQEL